MLKAKKRQTLSNNKKSASSSDPTQNNCRRKLRVCVLATVVGLGLLVLGTQYHQAVDLELLQMSLQLESPDSETPAMKYAAISIASFGSTTTSTRIRDTNNAASHEHDIQENNEVSEEQTVHFLNATHVTTKDAFSASWLQSKSDFMDMNLKSIGLCEDAAFKAWNTRMEKLRQPLDVLNFAVEHLSKWWALLNIYDNPIAYESLMEKFETYMDKASNYPTPTDPVLKNTVATIAFIPYQSRGNPNDSKRLTTLSLGCTLESLRRAEMGRVVVVMLEEVDEAYALDTFQYLGQKLSPTIQIMTSSNNNNNNNNNVVTKLGHMEVAFVKISPATTRTNIIKNNMPYGCLFHIRKAFALADTPSDQRTAQDIEYLQTWFGTDQDPSYWKYLYLTEPDSILQSRPSTLKQLKAEVDAGGIIAPHRLQPIPHESDVRGLQDKSLYLNEADGFQDVIVLDAVQDKDVCCDDNTKPGKTEFPNCPKNFRWWSCGLRHKDPADDDPQKRLRPYKLIRLAQGVGLTTIAGTLHARRCIPAKQSYCTFTTTV